MQAGVSYAEGLEQRPKPRFASAEEACMAACEAEEAYQAAKKAAIEAGKPLPPRELEAEFKPRKPPPPFRELPEGEPYVESKAFDDDGDDPYNVPLNCPGLDRNISDRKLALQAYEILGSYLPEVNAFRLAALELALNTERFDEELPLSPAFIAGLTWGATRPWHMPEIDAEELY